MTKHTLPLLVALMFLGAGCSAPTPTATPETAQIPAVTTTSAELDLSNQGLTSVPMDTFENTELTHLDVSHNNLGGALPAEIRHLQSLLVLDASNNNMTGVPAEIGQLGLLHVLNLANNNLTGLPQELGNLKMLETLDVSGNNYNESDLDFIRRAIPHANIITE